MEIYRENGGYRAIKTRVSGDAGGIPSRKPVKRRDGRVYFQGRKWRTWGSFSRGKPSLSTRRCGYVGFLLAPTSLFALPPSLPLNRTCVSRTGYKRGPRYYKPQITPPPPSFPATWMCEPKTAGLRQCETFHRTKYRSALLENETIHGFPRMNQGILRVLTVVLDGSKRENVLSSRVYNDSNRWSYILEGRYSFIKA